MRIRFVASSMIIACGSGGSGSLPENGGSGGTLDCAWIDSANCWKAAVDAIRDCASGDPSGVLAADRRSCTYPDGRSVSFDPPLATDGDGSTTYGFTLSKGGKQCVKFDGSPGSDVTMTTPTGTVRWKATAPSTLTITCPDGSSVQTNDYLGLRMCHPNMPLQNMPGFVTQSRPVAGIDATGGTPKQVQLFYCR